jgi:hypothetical protein
MRRCAHRSASVVVVERQPAADVREPSFFADMVMPSASEAVSRTMSRMERSAWPGSRGLTNHAFSAKRAGVEEQRDATAVDRPRGRPAGSRG